MNPFNDLLDTLAYAVLTVELIPPLEVDEDPCCGEADPCAFPFCSDYDSEADGLCDPCSTPDIGGDVAISPLTYGVATNTNPVPFYEPQPALRSFTVYGSAGQVCSRGTIFPSGRVVLILDGLLTYDNFQDFYEECIQRSDLVVLFDK